MSLSLCTTQDNMNRMHALKKATQWSRGGKNHSRWRMSKTIHAIYYWKVLIVCRGTVLVDWKSSSRGSCRGHGEKCLLHTAVLSFRRPIRSLLQHTTLLQDNQVTQLLKLQPAHLWRAETSLQIGSSWREDPLKHDNHSGRTIKSHSSAFQGIWWCHTTNHEWLDLWPFPIILGLVFLSLCSIW